MDVERPPLFRDDRMEQHLEENVAEFAAQLGVVAGANRIVQFVRLHKAHEQGLPVWRDRPEYVRRNTIARVPPMQFPGVVK